MNKEDTQVVEIFDKDIENLGNDLDKMIEHLNIVIATHNKQVEEIERLNNIIKIMEKYFELIVDLGYGYDGLNSEDSLKRLIDELCRYASLGRAYNTTEPIFENENKKYNILNEELKESE